MRTYWEARLICIFFIQKPNEVWYFPGRWFRLPIGDEACSGNNIVHRTTSNAQQTTVGCPP